MWVETGRDKNVDTPKTSAGAALRETGGICRDSMGELCGGERVPEFAFSSIPMWYQ